MLEGQQQCDNHDKNCPLRILSFVHVCYAVTRKSVVVAAALIVNTEKRHSHINAVSGIRDYTYLTNFLLSFFSSLSYDRSTASPKASSPQVRSSAPSFNLQYPLFSLKSSSSCFTSSSSSSRHFYPSIYLSFNSVF